MNRISDPGQNPDYYAARAVEERRLAMASNDPKVRAIHLEMADRYAELAQAGGAGPKPAADEGQQRTA
jgi:hypothetical protein